jgi:hypothetical protein
MAGQRQSAAQDRHPYRSSHTDRRRLRGAGSAHCGPHLLCRSRRSNPALERRGTIGRGIGSSQRQLSQPGRSPAPGPAGAAASLPAGGARPSGKLPRTSDHKQVIPAATSGHAAVAPPSRVINSRRFTPDGRGSSCEPLVVQRVEKDSTSLCGTRVTARRGPSQYGRHARSRWKRTCARKSAVLVLSKRFCAAWTKPHRVSPMPVRSVCSTPPRHPPISGDLTQFMTPGSQ